MRDPHVQWCERCTPLSLDNGAAYSIIGCFVFRVNVFKRFSYTLSGEKGSLLIVSYFSTL